MDFSNQMMSLTYWIVVVGLGLVTALNPVIHQTNEESLRSALNAVTRKQRSLNANAQGYYSDLSPLKYRDDNGDRNLERQQVGSGEIDDNEESLAFLPSVDGTGQLETIGGGYQHLNNKQFGRALMDYLQYSANQEIPIQSIFRERERTGSHKRNGNVERGKISEEDLERLLFEVFQNNLNGNEEPFDPEYQRNLEILYDKYLNEPDNIYSDDPINLSELLRKEDHIEEDDPRFSQITSVDRRNVNARYPLFSRDYKINQELTKRFPVTKRSTKDMNTKRQATDPKVAQDLGALFGMPTNGTVNRSQPHDHDNLHDHDHNHDHNHDHSHDHNHDHNHEHNHDHVKGVVNTGHAFGHTSELPELTTNLKNLKDASIKTNKFKEDTIEVKKKSIDWSQYFGIDRRKKKAAYVGRPGTQDQDDEYLLQKYYDVMAENLYPTDIDEGKRREQMEQIDSTLINMKSMIIKEVLQHFSKNDTENQEVKEEIISHLNSMAHSIERLRKALKELINRETPKESHKDIQSLNELTANVPTSLNKNKNKSKYNKNQREELQDMDDESYCPQIDIVERRCKATETFIGDFRQVLHIPCVAYHICNTCDKEGCLERFTLEAQKICQDEGLEDSLGSKKYCIQSAMLLPRYTPSVSPSGMCNSDISDTCLARYHYFIDSPYASPPLHRRLYDLASLKR